MAVLEDDVKREEEGLFKAIAMNEEGEEEEEGGGGEVLKGEYWFGGLEPR